MKKIIVLFSLNAFLFHINPSHSQDTVKGGYTGCIVNKCYFKDGAWDTTSKYIATEYSYNENGNKTKEIQYDFYGTKSYFWKYDEKGNELEYKWVHNTGTMYYGYPGEKWIPDVDSGLTTHKYDSMGKLIEKIEYDTAGYFISKNSWQYNDKGLKTEEVSYYPDGSVDLTKSYLFDSKGNIIRIKWKSSKHGSDKVRYKYNENGDLVKEKNYNTFGLLYNKYTTKYNDMGKVKKNNGYTNFGWRYWKEIYKYDNDGNLIEDAAYNGVGALRFKNTWKYDTNGICIEAVKYRSDGTVRENATAIIDDSGIETDVYFEYNFDGSVKEKTTKKYNKKEILIEEEYQLFDKEQYWNSRHNLKKYNDQGKIIEEVTYISDGTIYRKSEWEYDAYGNLTGNAEYNESEKPRDKLIYHYFR